MSEIKKDGVKSFLGLPHTITHQEIIFNLTIEVGDIYIRIGYKIGMIMPTSKDYKENVFQTTWNNPNADTLTSYLYLIDYIKNDFDLWVAAIDLRQMLIERDIIQGEKWDKS